MRIYTTIKRLLSTGLKNKINANELERVLVWVNNIERLINYTDSLKGQYLHTLVTQKQVIQAQDMQSGKRGFLSKIFNQGDNE